MSAINSSSYGDSSGAGAMLALKSQRDQKEINRTEAIRMGKGVQTDEQVEKKVRQVAEDFVSVFMDQVMKSMRATVQENPMMHGDNGEKFFQEMLDTEQSKTLAKGSGFGLTDLIYESMMTSYRVQQPDQTGSAIGPANANDKAYEADLEAEAEPELAVDAIL
ncbi:MAG: rod-binding protein [Planctomycetaceae bacterium]|nr:rod-binding protein [Planctomycetaceae bacterium]